MSYIKVTANTTGNGIFTFASPGTNTNRILLLPDADDTLSGLAASQTLTNKTLTNPTINGFTGDTSVVNLGSGQFYKDSSGKVGVGTTTPAGLLDVASRGITKASMPTGSILQVVQTVLSSTVSVTANGTEQQLTGLATSITPSSTTSKILILLNLNYC